MARKRAADAKDGPSPPPSRRTTRTGVRQQLQKELATMCSPSTIREALKGNAVEMETVVEQNILAMLDNDARGDAEDDRLVFLESVYQAALFSDNPRVPTKKVYEALFQCFEDIKSLELILFCSQLLTDLEKVYPRVALSRREGTQLVLDHKVWSPLVPSNGGLEKDDTVHVDMFSIVKTLAGNLEQKTLAINVIGKILLFQHFVNLFKTDFQCRLETYKETLDLTWLENSFLKQHFKALDNANYEKFLNCLLVIIDKCSEKKRWLFGGGEVPSNDTDAVAPANAVFYTALLSSVQELFSVLLELDECIAVRTLSQNGPRKDTMEAVLDILHYSHDISSVLQAIHSPNQKLSLVLRFIVKHAPTSIAKEMGSENGKVTLENLLSFFICPKKWRILNRSIEDPQLLLAHAFQAVILNFASDPGSYGDAGKTDLLRTCELLLSAFENISDKAMDMHPTTRQAIVIAKALVTS